MNRFTNTFSTWSRERAVEMVHLLDIELPDGTTGYVSTRRLVVNVLNPDGVTRSNRTYVRKLQDISGVSQCIDGSSASATFTLSNVDRTLSTAARDHLFFRARVTYRVFLPQSYGSPQFNTFEESSHIFWSGYVTSIDYDANIFEMDCSDGFFSLTLPLPRRRFTRTCQHLFDDGVFCPYSGYGHQQQRASDGTIVADQLVQLLDVTGAPIQSVLGYQGETFSPNSVGVPAGSSDFDMDINQSGDPSTREGRAARPGYTSCNKTFNDCFLRGMQRFFGGLRYVTSWATGRSGGSTGMGSWFSSGDPYTTFSSANDSIFNTAVPLLYCNIGEMPVSPITLQQPAFGFIVAPLIYQYRYEDTYTVAEGFTSLGRVGIAADGPLGANAHAGPGGGQDGQDVVGQNDVLINGLAPHEGQRPIQIGSGVSRSTGRIGEHLQWEGIGGDLANADKWINPITGNTETPPEIKLSQYAGVSARVFDKNSGINNPQVANQSTSASGAGSSPLGYSGTNPPDMRVNIGEGMFVWQYDAPDSRFFAPTGNPMHVLVDLYLQAMEMKYRTIADHATILDLDTVTELGNYTIDQVPNIVNPDVMASRYTWAGQITDVQPAVDVIDSILQDMYAFRFWRGRKLAVKPYCAGNFQSDLNPRPAFQEFVNILDTGSQSDNAQDFKVTQLMGTGAVTQNQIFNSLQLNYADVDFDFQKNTATIYSEDHQLFFGGDAIRVELSKSVNLAGTPTTDVATRMGARWLKDNLGGHTRAQWAKNVQVTFNSTLMMGELEVGDITYVAHTLVPHGGQWMRVYSWQINSDFSITWVLNSFEISNYDDTLIGVSSVGLAQFAYNPFIPGSGGIAYLPLPALLWADEVTPRIAPGVETISNLGVRLTWLPYNENPAFDDAIAKQWDGLTLAVQIFRTPAVKIREDFDDAATTIKVNYTLNLPLAPFNLRIDDPTDLDQVDNEIMTVTSIDHENRLLTVTRGQEMTTAVAHTAGEFLYYRLYPGGFLGAKVSATATTWIVDDVTADFKVGEKYYVEKEIILVNEIHQDIEDDAPITRIVVVRGQKLDDNDPNGVPTVPQSHAKLQQVRSVFYLDATPDFQVAQFGTTNDYNYIDPWLEGAAVPSSSTTSTTSTESTTTTTTESFTTTSSETSTDSSTSTTTTTTTTSIGYATTFLIAPVAPTDETIQVADPSLFGTAAGFFINVYSQNSGAQETMYVQTRAGQLWGVLRGVFGAPGTFAAGDAVQNLNPL